MCEARPAPNYAAPGFFFAITVCLALPRPLLHFCYVLCPKPAELLFIILARLAAPPHANPDRFCRVSQYTACLWPACCGVDQLS